MSISLQSAADLAAANALAADVGAGNETIVFYEDGGTHGAVLGSKGTGPFDIVITSTMALPDLLINNIVATANDKLSLQSGVVEKAAITRANLITVLGTRLPASFAPTDAEVNVKPDWDAAVNADAEILNKPVQPTVGDNGLTAKNFTAALFTKLNSLANYDDTTIVDSLDDKEDTSAKGQDNGYAGLDADGKVPATQLPIAATGVIVEDNVNSLDGTHALSAKQGKLMADVLNEMALTQLTVDQKNHVAELTSYNDWSTNRSIGPIHYHNTNATRSNRTPVDEYLSLTASDDERIGFIYTGITADDNPDHPNEYHHYPSLVRIRIRGYAHSTNGDRDSFNVTYFDVSDGTVHSKKIYKEKHHGDWRWHKGDKIHCTVEVTDQERGTEFTRLYTLDLKCLSGSAYEIESYTMGDSLADIHEIEKWSEWK